MKILLFSILIILIILVVIYLRYCIICKAKNKQFLDEITSLLDGTYAPREVEPIEEKCRTMRKEAKKLYYDKKYEEAIKIYDELLKIEPDCPFYLEEQADVFEAIHNYDDCIKNYKKALNYINKQECFSAYSYYSHKLSKVYYKIGKIKDAVKAATIAIKSNPDAIVHVDYAEPFCIDMTLEYTKEMAYSDRAELYFKIGEYKKALKDINLMEFEIAPNLILKIKILAALKDFQEAAKCCQDNELNKYEKYVCMAYIEKEKGDFSKAINLLKQALNMTKEYSAWITNKEVYKEIADMYEKSGLIKEALDYHFKYVDYCKKYKEISDFYFRNGDYKNAINSYTEHLKKDSYDDKALFIRAQAYKNIHDISSAIKDTEAAIRLKPKNNEYKEFLQLLK